MVDGVRMQDGRWLTLEERGDPDGTPVVLLHGTPGCRFGLVPEDVMAAHPGVRFIAYDRPGYGGSDRLPGRRMADAARAAAIRRDPAQLLVSIRDGLTDADRRIVSPPAVGEMLLRNYREAVRTSAYGAASPEGGPAVVRARGAAVSRRASPVRRARPPVSRMARVRLQDGTGAGDAGREPLEVAHRRERVQSTVPQQDRPATRTTARSPTAAPASARRRQ